MPVLRAVVVGSNIAATGGSALRYAERDAAVFAERLEGQRLYDSVITRSLIGRSTASELWGEVARLVSTADAGDASLFYFAGHGMRELDVDGTQQLWLSSSLRTGTGPTGSATRLASVFDALAASRAKSVVAILDCCFSGTQGGRSVLGPEILRLLSSGRPLLRKRPPSLPGEGRIVLTASRHDQAAHESSVYEHGLFTHVLLRRLSASRGKGVDVATVYASVRADVLQLTGGAQCPSWFGGDEGLELPVLPERAAA